MLQNEKEIIEQRVAEAIATDKKILHFKEQIEYRKELERKRVAGAQRKLQRAWELYRGLMTLRGALNQRINGAKQRAKWIAKRTKYNPKQIPAYEDRIQQRIAEIGGEEEARYVNEQRKEFRRTVDYKKLGL